MFQFLARLFHSPTMSHLRSHGPIVRCIELETSKFMSIPKPMSPPSLRLRDHIDRPVTPNSLPSLIGRAPTSNTIFNARDGVSPLQVKHRNCNLCCLLIWFFFFPMPCRFGYVLYKSLPLGPVIQKFCRSPPMSCPIKLEIK